MRSFVALHEVLDLLLQLLIHFLNSIHLPLMCLSILLQLAILCLLGDVNGGGELVDVSLQLRTFLLQLGDLVPLHHHACTIACFF